MAEECKLVRCVFPFKSVSEVSPGKRASLKVAKVVMGGGVLQGRNGERRVISPCPAVCLSVCSCHGDAGRPAP